MPDSSHPSAAKAAGVGETAARQSAEETVRVRRLRYQDADGSQSDASSEAGAERSSENGEHEPGETSLQHVIRVVCQLQAVSSRRGRQ